MTLEELERVITHSNITNDLVEEEDGKLCRDRSFTIDGKKYRIEWWCNLMYLHHEGLMVVFDKIEQSGTWPNRSKLNLQMYLQGSVVAIIELEMWP